jgi:hypothetical protein
MRFTVAGAMALLATAALAATNWQAAGKQWWSHVQFLADDKLEGRNVGSPGFDTAADYVVHEFERAGLAPGAKSSYSQPVGFTKLTLNEAQSRVTLSNGGAVNLADDAHITSTVNVAELDAPLVFAGYGLDMPEANYSDLKSPELKGAIAVYIAGGPPNVTPELRSHYSSAGERVAAMKAAGVIGTIAIPNPRSMDIPWERQTANRLQARMFLADPAFQQNSVEFSATWNPAHADRLFLGSGHDLAEIFDAADHGRPVPHFTLMQRLRAHVAVTEEPVQSRNIAGIRAGSDPRLKNEFIVISAHLDHLGTGERVNGDGIFNGAMDDASGVASVIEIARALKNSRIRTKRSILFLTVTGEEKGLLGSNYFARFPTASGKIVADINMDMFLPLFPLRYLEVQGLNESSLGDDIRAAASSQDVQVQADKEPNANRFIRSDQYSFVRRGIPALAFKFGWIPGSPEEKTYKDWYRDRYHAVGDDLTQPVDLEAAAKFNAILTSLVERVADAPQAPQWKADSFFRRFAK